MSEHNEYKSRRRVNHAEKPPKTAAQALSSLMRLCSRRECSSSDALRLMRRWGVAEGERAGVLARLEEARFIDDRRFAASYLRDKMSFSGWGPYKITSGLVAKGISREIIAEVMADADPEGEGGDRLAGLVEKKMSRTKYRDIYDLRAKLIRYGASLGYPYDEVLGAVEKAMGSIPDRD